MPCGTYRDAADDRKMDQGKEKRDSGKPRCRDELKVKYIQWRVKGVYNGDSETSMKKKVRSERVKNVHLRNQRK